MDSKPSVCYVHGSLGLGGAEVLRLSVLEQLKCEGKYNLRVCILREPGVLASEVKKLGVACDVLHNRGGLFDVAGIRKLAQYLSIHKPDIVESSQFITNLHTSLACRLSGMKRLVIEEHGVYRWKRWYHKLLDRWVIGRAQAVLACSHCVAESASVNLGIAKERVTVIHNCASKQHFEKPQKSTEAIRSELVGDCSFVAISVGTLRWEKGYPYLIESWLTLLREKSIASDSKLLIVGEGPLEQELREKADASPSILFLGRRQDTRDLLAAADLFVLPSVNEGFGIAIVEAMCAGLPVISTVSGGIPEVIDSGRTGVLVEPNSSAELAKAIRQLYSQKAERVRLGRAARIDAESRFAPVVYCRQLSDLYRSLLDRTI